MKVSVSEPEMVLGVRHGNKLHDASTRELAFRTNLDMIILFLWPPLRRYSHACALLVLSITLWWRLGRRAVALQRHKHSQHTSLSNCVQGGSRVVVN